MNTIRRRATAALLSGAALVTLTGCAEQLDPCRHLPAVNADDPETRALLETVNQGYEVEGLGVDGAECDLQRNGTWLEEGEEPE